MRSENDRGSRPGEEALRTIDFTYRFSPADPKPFFAPGTWQEAQENLLAGNAQTVKFYEACQRGGYLPGEPSSAIEISVLEAHGEPRGADGLPVQYPFALVLGCSDARAPTEFVFGQEFNDIFNIRVAGNVLAEEGIGSLQYALRSFVPEGPWGKPRSLRLVLVLGHRGCGAVKAAVEAYLGGGSPDGRGFPADPIGSILRLIADPPLDAAVRAFDDAFGAGASRDRSHLASLVELVVHLNAAWVGHQLRHWVDREGLEIASRVGVAFAVFDPGDLRVRCRPCTPLGSGESGPFGAPPRDRAELDALAAEMARLLRGQAADFLV